LSLLALDFANGGDVPFLGIGSSVGLPNAPVNVWILAIPYALSSDPQLATQFIAFMNVLSVGFVYLMGRRYGGPWVGLFAALIYAANPWAVIFSRKIWAQNMLPLFVLLTVFSGMLGFYERKRWAQMLHFPLLALTGQIHYGAFVIIPMTLTLLVGGWRHIQWRWLGMGALLTFLMVLPYLIGMNNAGLNTPSAIRAALDNAPDSVDEALSISDEALRGAVIMFSGVDLHSLAGPQAFMNYLASVPDVYPLFYVICGLVALSSLWGFWRLFSPNLASVPRVIIATILSGFVFPIVIYLVNWTPFFIHYLIPAQAFGFLLLAFAVNDIAERMRGDQKRIMLGIVSSVVVIIIAFQAYLFWELLQFVDENYTPDGFGTPLERLADVRDATLENGERVIVSVGGQDIGINDEATVWRALLYDAPSIQFEDADTQIFPVVKSTVLSNQCDDSGEEFVLRSVDEGCYRVSDRSEGALEREQFTPFSADVTRFANGAMLDSFDWQNDDAQACLDILWEVQAETDINYSFAVQFLNVAGDVVAAGDGPALRGVNWRSGDTVIQTFCISRDDAISQVRLGMYTFDGVNFSNVDLIAADQTAVGQQFIQELP